VSPLGTLLLPQPRVYQKEPCCLPSLPTTHYPPTTFLRPLFSYSLAPIREGYELLSPPARRTLGGQPLCFDIHPHCPGVWGLSSLTLCFSAAACPDLANASPFVSCSYGLFVTPKNVKSFAIKQIQTLFAKHPGWGVSRIPNASTGQTLRFLAVSSSVVSVPLWQIASHQVSDQDAAGGVVGAGGAQVGDGGGAVFAA
jgi:hypothetical protein